MILGCIADDFTGASDLASILTSQGMRTSLLTSVEDVHTARADAVVVALKTRSIPRDDAVRQSISALRELQAAGCRQFYFKYCSTFDSTPQGNIGPVAEALAEELGAEKVVFCPSFPDNGRTLYNGHLFVGDRLLSESSMRDHPITPMTDSDLRAWLSLQCQGSVGHVPHKTVRGGHSAIAAAIAASPAPLVLVDALSNEDLREIGRAAADMILLTGGSALAMALPDNFRRDGLIDRIGPATALENGPAILFAGSCSAATNKQVAHYRKSNPSYAIDGRKLIAGFPILEEADQFVENHFDEGPLIYSTIPPEKVSEYRDDEDFPLISGAIERLMAELAVRAVERGVRRIIVAGGETSGAVVEALQPGEMVVGPDIAAGVPILASGGITFALKSGNFGGDDFFEAALRLMEHGK